MFYLISHYKIIFGSLAVIVTMSNLLYYFWQLLRHDVQPHAFSWLLWALTLTIVFALQTVGHGGAGAWSTLMAGLLCGLIGVVAWRHDEVKITRSDWVFLIGALTALPVWAVTKVPLAALIILTFIDGVGYFPTIRKSWIDPWHESISVFVIGAVFFILSGIGVEEYNLTTLLYQSTMVVIHVLLVSMLYLRRHVIPSKSPAPLAGLARTDV